MVQITDLHLQQVDRHVRAVVQAANSLRPHVVVLTGDMIDQPDRIRELGLFLSLLDPSPVKLATLGNWEHWGGIDLGELASEYHRRSCRLLINETASFRFKGREVLFTGLDDSTGGTPRVGDALRGIRPVPNHIILAHSPVYRDAIASAPARHAKDPASAEDAEIVKHSFSCMLAGHTHGGQIAPFGWAPLRPPGSGRYVSGWYRDATPHLYVSRGIGTSVVPVRFGAPPELTLFEWGLAAAKQAGEADTLRNVAVRIIDSPAVAYP